VPVRIERLPGVRFRIEVLDEIPYVEAEDEETAVAQTVGIINRHVEVWVRAKPEDWFWVHRRWPKEVYKAPDPAEAAAAFSDRMRAQAS
jgi:KDO2-lipid IV(A) lauroyltransferase